MLLSVATGAGSRSEEISSSFEARLQTLAVDQGEKLFVGVRPLYTALYTRCTVKCTVTVH